MMTPEQHRAVVELVLRRISSAEFLERTGLDPAARPEIIESELRGALVSKDANTVESALMLAFHLDCLTADLAPLLAALLPLPWHHQHEDIASALQRLRVPATADALAQAALVKHDYLHIDDSHAFARKCTWALADIGTPEARAHLESLAHADDTEIAAYAQRRLENWEDEMSRKGSAPRLQSNPVSGAAGKTSYVVDGNAFLTLEEFSQHFSERVLRGYRWRGNLDAFNDVLRGGFGTPDGGFVLVWRDHALARSRLGQTMFDLLVEIIRDHGEGGSQAEDGVELVLA